MYLPRYYTDHTSPNATTTEFCTCPPAPYGKGNWRPQIHNDGCSLNPSKRCHRCKGTDREPLAADRQEGL